ncbi:MAG: preprotein translocase subunit SecG [Hyphomicrobiaceae bacterium]|nr:preprotein translocase subunit SecG [Hyphomicrobiaceae bacterium]
MATVLLVIHLMIAAGLVGVVLLQRSEGGALGMGGGGGGGGFLTGRGTANLLTRTTAALAAGFFFTSLMLTILANQGTATRSILDTVNQPAQTAPGTAAPSPTPAGEAPAAPRGGLLDKLQGGPQVPQNR